MPLQEVDTAVEVFVENSDDPGTRIESVTDEAGTFLLNALRRAQALCAVTVSDAGSFANAITRITNEGRGIIVVDENETLGATTYTIPADCQLWCAGGTLTLAAGSTVTVNGLISGSSQIFDNSNGGTLTLSDDAIDARWFGTVGDGLTDDTDAVQQAVNCGNASDRPVQLRGDILTSSSVTLPTTTTKQEIRIHDSWTLGATLTLQENCKLRGTRANSGFVPSSSIVGPNGSTAIATANGASGCMLENLAITAGTTATAVNVYKADTFEIRDCSITSATLPLNVVGVFWMRVFNSSILRSSYDGSSAVIFTDEAGSLNNYLIDFRGVRIFRGPIQFSRDGGSSSVFRRDIGFHRVDFEQIDGGPLFIVDSDVDLKTLEINTVGTWDQGAGTTAIVDCDGTIQTLIVRNCVMQYDSGVVTGNGRVTDLVLDNNSPLYSTSKIGTPQATRVHVVGVGEMYGYRGQLAPAVARYTNLASHTLSGADSSGITAPDGSSSAYRYTTPIALRSFYAGSRSTSVGDYVIAGVWVRSVTGYVNASAVLQVTNTTMNRSKSNWVATTGNEYPELNVPGAWRFIVGWDRIASVDTTPNEWRWGIKVDSGDAWDVCWPVIYHIPAAECSDEEARRIAEQLVSHPTSVGAGELCTLDHQMLSVGNGLWDGGHLEIGRDQHVWMYDDKLRYKASAPTAEDDGDILGFGHRVATNDVLFGDSDNIHVTYGVWVAATTGLERNWGMRSSGGKLQLLATDGTAFFEGDSTNAYVPDAINVQLGTTSGSKIGTTVSQKLGLHGATPTVQRASADQAALTDSTGGGVTDSTLAAVAGSGADTNINDNFAKIAELVNELRSALVEKGVIKGSA